MRVRVPLAVELDRPGREPHDPFGHLVHVVEVAPLLPAPVPIPVLILHDLSDLSHPLRYGPGFDAHFRRVQQVSGDLLHPWGGVDTQLLVDHRDRVAQPYAVIGILCGVFRVQIVEGHAVHVLRILCF